MASTASTHTFNSATPCTTTLLTQTLVTQPRAILRRQHAHNKSGAHCSCAAVPLKHKYWLLRHGKSKANEAGIIVSTLANGVKPQWGLSDVGRKQAIAAGEQLRLTFGPEFDYNTLAIHASPFSRTMQTAQLASEQLPGAASSCSLEPTVELRERDFGAHELCDDSNYAGVWAQDAISATSKPTPDGTGESVEEVAARLSQLLTRLEGSKNHTHLLVAHGDTLSILAALLANDLPNHRTRPGLYLDTGGLRLLNES